MEKDELMKTLADFLIRCEEKGLITINREPIREENNPSTKPAETMLDLIISGLVIVQGDPVNSRLLRLALPLGDNNDNISYDLKSIIGYSVNIRRAIGHWVYSNHFYKLKEYIK